MFNLGILLVIIGLFIATASFRQGIDQDKQTNKDINLYDLLTHTASLGLYVTLAGFIFALM